MNIIKLIILCTITFIIGMGIGFYFLPEKIKTVDKIVEKEVIKVIHEKFDPVTGKVVERTTTDETKNNTSTKTKEEIIKSKKQYAVKGGAAINPRDLSGKLIPRVAAEVRLPFFNSWLGVEGDINIDRPLVGGYLRLEF